MYIGVKGKQFDKHMEVVNSGEVDVANLS